ncbi:MAG: hypothetical protein CSA96_05205 [Bacteroidetes bacterium]|nr:MAG: hypothetical protein CSA96_05205 [Bacteroidota bacterium]
MKSDRILFLLSGNLSTTPRALKTIRYLGGAGCRIVLVSRSPVWLQKDLETIEALDLKVRILDLTRNHFFSWLRTGLLHKLALLFCALGSNSLKWTAYASEKAGILLCSAEKGLKREAFDLVIAHGYGTLYAAFRLATKMQIPFIYDAEDYHPGETIALINPPEQRRRTALMKAIYPRAKSLFYASPLIRSYSEKLVGGSLNPITLNNSFPAEEFTEPAVIEGELRLIWFSQLISMDRGLGLLFEALEALERQDWELTLIGRNGARFEAEIPPGLKQHVKLLPPMQQTDLHKALANYDVGLALELSGHELNRNICLTNKIHAYAQAGLYILATDTRAQQAFIRDETGLVCSQEPRGMKEALSALFEKKTEIRSRKQKRFLSARKLAWEYECEKIKELGIHA